MIWVSIGALAHKDEPEGELHTRGRTDTDDDDWYSAEKHAWAASAEERATCARVPAMRGMRQSPQTPLGGPAVAASTQSDQRRSAGASFPRARHQRPCLAYTSNALRGGCRTARRDGLNRIARAGISRAIPGKSSLAHLQLIWLLLQTRICQRGSKICLAAQEGEPCIVSALDHPRHAPHPADAVAWPRPVPRCGHP